MNIEQHPRNMETKLRAKLKLIHGIHECVLHKIQTAAWKWALRHLCARPRPRKKVAAGRGKVCIVFCVLCSAKRKCPESILTISPLHSHTRRDTPSTSPSSILTSYSYPFHFVYIVTFYLSPLFCVIWIHGETLRTMNRKTK